MISDIMPENKKEEICQVCDKPIDLENDDFIAGMTVNGQVVFSHFSCLRDNEKELAKEMATESIEDEDW